MDAGLVADLVEEASSIHQVPGAQVGLLRGTERLVVCAGAHGVDDPTPVSPDSRFHAGSLAKALTGLVVFDAARRGVLELDAACADQAPGQWSHSPRAILAQTTGAPNVLPEADEPLDAFVERTAALPPVHEPGRFSYCNAGWSALDLLLQQLDGASFEGAAQALLGPLTFGAGEAATAGHAVGPQAPLTTVPPMGAPAASAAGSRWWVTADGLLDHARLHLEGGGGRVDPHVVASVRSPGAALPGATVFDRWGQGWALWDRGDHQAFGWAGYTGGHRAFLRCFPRQDAAVVVLANSAGPLFGPPGGSALFDDLLPRLLDELGVPPLGEPADVVDPTPATDLIGQYGPLVVEAIDDDALRFDGAAFGSPGAVTCARLRGNTFVPAGFPPGSTPIAVDRRLLYVGPFALPRVD